ncbi:MAG: Rpn family recombination-promoting nuclease/putative transposase [Microcystaceae cyanobacterium]
MVKKADLGSKRLISLSPDRWVQWIMERSDIQVKEIVSEEFQWLERESDVLIKVSSPLEGEFILANEIQLRYKNNLPQRMRNYTALAEEKYNLPVYPVLINILPFQSPQVIPTAYESEFMGIRAYQDYRVINLWEIDVNLVFDKNLTSLLPFVPILQGGDDPPKVRQALRGLREDETLQDLEPLLSFFASFVLEIPVVRDIMRWDMTVLRESPWYNTILEEGWQGGHQAGYQAGREEGREEGLKQGETTLVLRLLDKQFNSVDESIKAQIRTLNTNQLEALGEALLDFTVVEDVGTWLAQFS